jgi:hypothetical protein
MDTKANFKKTPAWKCRGIDFGLATEGLWLNNNTYETVIF